MRFPAPKNKANNIKPIMNVSLFIIRVSLLYDFLLRLFIEYSCIALLKLKRNGMNIPVLSNTKERRVISIFSI
ncbi:hypothetical protein GCM10008934_18990 [Virgibacillus salarius]